MFGYVYEDVDSDSYMVVYARRCAGLSTLMHRHPYPPRFVVGAQTRVHSFVLRMRVAASVLYVFSVCVFVHGVRMCGVASVLCPYVYT